MEDVRITIKSTHDGELDDNGGEGLVAPTLRLFRQNLGKRRSSSCR